jgi:hypothetical protein
MKFSYTARIILVIGICAVAVFMLYRSYTERALEEAAIGTQIAVAQGIIPKLVDEEAELQSQLTQLENDLNQAESQVNKSKASFEHPVESIEYDDMLFQLADERDLDIVRLTATEPHDQETDLETIYSEEELEQIYEEINFEDTDQELAPTNFSLTYFTVEVKGKPIAAAPKTEREHQTYINQTVANILDYINALITSDDFISATFEIVNFEIAEPLTTPDLEEMIEAEIPEEEIIRETGSASATIRFVVYYYEGE